MLLGRPPQCLLETQGPITSLRTPTRSAPRICRPSQTCPTIKPNTFRRMCGCSSVYHPLQCNLCSTAHLLTVKRSFCCRGAVFGNCRALQPSKNPLLCPFMSLRSSPQRLPWMPPMRCQKQRVMSVPFCFGRTRDISTFLFQAPRVLVFNPLEPRGCSRALVVTWFPFRLAAFSRSQNTFRCSQPSVCALISASLAHILVGRLRALP